MEIGKNNLNKNTKANAKNVINGYGGIKKPTTV